VSLTEYIDWLFDNYYRGKANAIKRRSLLWHLQMIDPSITDREMRLAYESLPICGGPEGLYYPLTEDERERQIEVNNKKRDSFDDKNDILRTYRLNGEPVQGRLF